MENEIAHNRQEQKVPALLLHSCCAPCSSYCLETLSEDFAITVFYYNPNIYPEEEYWKRVREQERFIGEISYEIDGRSKGAVHIEFPYASIYRISRAGYIVESSKRSAPDGRRRQYYRITEQGRAYLSQLDRVYHRFIGGVSDVLQKEGDTDG